MSLSARSATPPPPAQKRGNGCLWGCLIALLILALPPVLAGGYGAWFLWDGYRRDPVLRVVGEMVRHNGTAQAVLGDDIVITGVEGSFYSWMPGVSQDSRTVIVLEGAKGEGRLDVTSHAGLTGPKLDSAILTGPGGGRYDLLSSRTLSAPDSAI